MRMTMRAESNTAVGKLTDFPRVKVSLRPEGMAIIPVIGFSEITGGDKDGWLKRVLLRQWREILVQVSVAIVKAYGKLLLFWVGNYVVQRKKLEPLIC